MSHSSQVIKDALEVAMRTHRSIFPLVTKENPSRFKFSVVEEFADSIQIKVVDTEALKMAARSKQFANSGISYLVIPI